MENLIIRAAEYMDKGKYTYAGKCYEMAAAAADNKRKAVEYLKKAAQAYGKWGDTDNIVRCYRKVSQFLEKTAKAECLLDCWKAYVFAIAGCEWECCFEWRGDDCHEGDHDIYQGLLKEFQTEAEKVLREALNIAGVDKSRIIRLAKKECRRRERKDGWGSARCWSMVTNVIQDVHPQTNVNGA